MNFLYSRHLTRPRLLAGIAFILLSYHVTCSAHVATLNPGVVARGRSQVGYRNHAAHNWSPVLRRQRSLFQKSTGYSQSDLAHLAVSGYLSPPWSQAHESYKLSRHQAQRHNEPDHIIEPSADKGHLAQSEMGVNKRRGGDNGQFRLFGRVFQMHAQAIPEDGQVLERKHLGDILLSSQASDKPVYKQQDILDQLMTVYPDKKRRFVIPRWSSRMEKWLIPKTDNSGIQLNELLDSPVIHDSNLQSGNALLDTGHNRQPRATAETHGSGPSYTHQWPGADGGEFFEPKNTIDGDVLSVSLGLAGRQSLDSQMFLNNPEWTEAQVLPKVGQQAVPSQSWHSIGDLRSSEWSRGRFLDDDTDCQHVTSRTCQSDLDCQCHGLYTCAKGHCDLVTTDAQQVIDKHGWSKEPSDERSWLNSPIAESRFLAGPADKHGWFSDTSDKHRWFSSHVSDHVLVDGPTDEHLLLDNVIYFDPLQDFSQHQQTGHHTWHSQPFDLPLGAAGADLQPETDKHFSSYFGSSETDRSVSAETAIEQLAEGQVRQKHPEGIDYFHQKNMDTNVSWDSQDMPSFDEPWSVAM